MQLICPDMRIKKELQKKILLSAIAFSLYAFVTFNYVHAASLFLTDLGAGVLPFSYIAAGLIMLINSTVTSALSSRFSPDKITKGLIMFFILNFVVLSFLPAGAFAHTFYFMVIVLAAMNLEEVILNHFSNSMLTPLQAKSYMPTIYGFMSIGVILSSLLVVPYQELHEATGIGIIPAISLAFILALVFLTAKIFKRDINANFASGQKEKSKKKLKESFKFIFKESNLFKTLAVIVFLIVGVHLMMEFKLKTVLSANFGHESLTEILGLVLMVNRIIIWILSVFAVKRLLFRFGVINLLLIYPVTMVVMTLIAAAFQLHYLAVIALYFVYSASHFSLYGICTSQILSIVPKKIHQSVFFLMRVLIYAVSLLVFALVFLINSYDINL